TINRPVSFFDLSFNQPIDSSTFTTDDVLITGPEGVIEATSVTLLGGNVYRVDFENQRANGIYTLRVGPNIATHVGSLMDQDDDGVPGEEIEDVVSFSARVLLPDLTPSNLSLPTTPVLQASTITVRWFVHNQGSATAVANWTERIIASTDDILGNEDDVLLGSTTATSSLGKRNSKSFLRGTNIDSRNLDVVIPRTLIGEYQLFVQIDSGDQVVESNETNQTVSEILTVAPIPPRFDLTVSAIDVPGEMVAGSTIEVSWSVTNSGSSTTTGMILVDGIYLSSDDTLDTGDTVLDYNIHLGSLEPDSSYSETRSVSLPVELPLSTYRILVVTDVLNLLYETGGETNNVLASSPITLASQSNSVPLPAMLALAARESLPAPMSAQPSALQSFAGWTDAEAGYKVFALTHGSVFHLLTDRRRSGDWVDKLTYRKTSYLAATRDPRFTDEPALFERYPYRAPFMTDRFKGKAYPYGEETDWIPVKVDN
ncbi:MAG: hypothetical protein KJT03_17220, partial [Verrucomicrobiae bacterium]|nr:hypothetical protein [Verrucomicrobiae bacterium]